jgi:hypothetical protein
LKEKSYKKEANQRAAGLLVQVSCFARTALRHGHKAVDFLVKT